MKAIVLLTAAVLWSCPSLAFEERELAARSLRYFVDNAHPVTGLVRDRARNDGAAMGPSYDVASIAATGFGLAVLAHGARAGLRSRPAARAQILRTLESALRLDHHHGWLYHFVRWDDGARAYSSEISTIDTALFLAGALYAGAAFPGTRIERLARQFHRRLDFETMRTDGGARPAKLTLSMGWKPESGYLSWNWDRYAEQMILLLLGLGHPARPLSPETWRGFTRADRIYGYDLPLFVHQYSHLFVDFRRFGDGYRNYFRNSVEATLFNRQVCLNGKSATCAAGLWGFSASGSRNGYRAFSPIEQDGTVCPGCAVASLPFTPALIRRDLGEWEELSEFSRFWGTYGFADSVNLEDGWFDPDALGITVGSVYLALADVGPDPIWKLFGRIAAVRKGIAAARRS